MYYVICIMLYVFLLAQDELLVCNHILGQRASVLCTGTQLRAGTDIYQKYPGSRSICALY